MSEVLLIVNWGNSCSFCLRDGLTAFSLLPVYIRIGQKTLESHWGRKSCVQSDLEGWIFSSLGKRRGCLAVEQNHFLCVPIALLVPLLPPPPHRCGSCQGLSKPILESQRVWGTGTFCCLITGYFYLLFYVAGLRSTLRRMRN